MYVCISYQCNMLYWPPYSAKVLQLSLMNGCQKSPYKPFSLNVPPIKTHNYFVKVLYMPIHQKFSSSNCYAILIWYNQIMAFHWLATLSLYLCQVTLSYVIKQIKQMINNSYKWYLIFANIIQWYFNRAIIKYHTWENFDG